LLNAINTNAYGNAQVAAWLNDRGRLVISAKNQTATLLVSGSYAANIGFGAGNNFFSPTAASASSGGSSASSGTSAASGTSSSGSSASSSSASSSSKSASSTSAANLLRNSALALQSTGTAEILLASSGSSGTILNMLA
jgi:perilipin-4